MIVPYEDVSLNGLNCSFNTETSSGGGGGGGGYGGSRFDRSDRRDGEMVTQEDTIFVSGMGENASEEDVNTHFGSIGVIKVLCQNFNPIFVAYYY